MLLDAFFKLAVPLVIFGVAFAYFVLSLNSRYQFYGDEEGKLRRAEINHKYRTNRGAVIIAFIFLLIYSGIVYGLIDEWGAKFFTFVISFLMIIPVMTICSLVIMLYMHAVHGWAHVKVRSKDPK